MKAEYDFSKAKRAKDVPHLNRLRKQASTKTRITIMLDNDVIEAYRRKAESAGTGYQTEINQALREHLSLRGEPVTLETLRRVVREELQSYGNDG